MGGLLLNSERTKDSWEQVANNVSSGVANDNDQWSQILSLSYSHLPHHLKPCFLYMGFFPEDYNIRASKLIMLWVAEGFLKPVKDKTLEEAAEVYLKALVERNLIFVREQEVTGRVKTYGIHDILRDLCVKKGSEEKFQQGTSSYLRRVGVHSPLKLQDIYIGSTELMGLARSIICTGRAPTTLTFSSSPLLRILDILNMEFRDLPEGIRQLVNLRYLAVNYRTPSDSGSDFHSLVGMLLNLQTFVAMSLSWNELSQLFSMPQIRHIKLCHTVPQYDYDKYIMVCSENLQTLSTVELYGVDVESFFLKFQNLRKLGISFHRTKSNVVDLSHLQKLHSLRCRRIWNPLTEKFVARLIFPLSLKKLTLEDCKIPKGFMNTVGTLPNLEVLKLISVEFETTTWESIEGEFIQLQFLFLQDLNLVNWIAEAEHFPSLKRLVINYCRELEEIPSGIGEIMSLESIEVDNSSPCVMNSARKIQEEQIEFGNDGLQVHIHKS